MRTRKPRARRSALIVGVLGVALLAAACRPAPPPPPPMGTVFTGLGFDACSAPSTSTMSSWLGSPYRAIGVYVGGGARACGQANLTASWVQTVRAQGWKLIPIYVGLQAPCNTHGLPTIDGNPAATYNAAFSQGIQSADDAVAMMGTLGVGGGNPIYYDMEAYPNTTDPACVAAVRAFTSGWAGQLHNYGMLAGFYSSAASGVWDQSAIYGSPAYFQLDEMWFAHWNGDASTNEPNKTWLPDTAWSNHQRIHQYAGGHNETFNSVTINIDSDFLDGAVVG